MYTRSGGTSSPLLFGVGFAEPDAEALRLVQFRGGQQEPHSAVSVGVGPPAPQVSAKRRAVDDVFGAHRVCLQTAEEFLAPCQPAVEQVRIAISAREVVAIAVDSVGAHRDSIP
jgi:hypothetical protein